MKYTFTFLFAVLAASLSAQQVSGSVETGAGYANQVWYSMANGEVAAAPKDNWDLAFEISGFTSSIRYNEQKGMKLYAAPFTIDEWAALDTTGMTANWETLHNDPKSWERGAFNQHPTEDVDLGWGIYNPITHVVSGDSLYVIQLANGDFKKLRIDNLASATFNFTFANIDGSAETEGQLVKSDFAGKNFGYYNLETNETVDREPASENWDITFTKYIDLVGPEADTPYGVTGILQNYNTPTAEAADVNVDQADPFAFTYSADINTIGHDWKSFDFESGYVIAEDLSYFIETPSGEIYQLIFTAFEGSATGVYEFTTEQVASTGISEVRNYELNAWPNPSQGQDINLTWNEAEIDRLAIFDLSGKLIHTQNISEQARKSILEAAQIPAGVYILQLSGREVMVSQKLIITN